MDSAFKYVEDHGLVSESTYPYTAETDSCQTSKTANPVVKVTDYHDVTANSPSALKAAVALGPVSVAIEADQLGFQFYTGGVFDGSCGTQLDHGVLVVGYGTDSESDKKYWKAESIKPPLHPKFP